MISDPRQRRLPTGLVTFLLTDIEASTALFRSIGELRYREVLSTHRTIIREVLAARDGIEVQTEGDSFLAVFRDPRAAVYAAVDAQRALRSHEWPADVALRVRMGLHMGHAELGDDDDDYVSLVLYQAARVGSVPRGGQTLITRAVADAIGVQPNVVLRPAGTYWLKDFPEPVALIAVFGSDDEQELLPPRAPRADLSNLPALRGPMLGRDAEIDELSGWLDQPGLTTLVGPGGVGKTRLALETAARQATAGTEVWLAELAGLSGRAARDADDDDDESVGAVVAVIARAIGSDATTPDALARQLGTSTMVLIIDNAEHLLDAVAEVAEVLLDGCPRLRLLVTSRAPLAVDGEAIYRLDPLLIPTEEMTPEEIDASPAVQLFAARARAADSSFALNPDNRTDIVDLCRMLDGLPLALELAAARISILRPQALLERVRSVGDLPGLPNRRRPSRHTTLHAVLDWSLSLCDEVEIAVLRRMAAFAGPVDLDAVVTVTAGDLLRPDQVVDALVGLVDKSLVVRRSGDVPRYELLVTIRQAALSRLLAEDERDEALQRHARWLLARAQDAAPNGLERDSDGVKILALELEVALERGANEEISPPDYAAIFIAFRDHLYTRDQPLGIRHGLHLADLELDDSSQALCLYVASKAMLEILHPDFVATTLEAIELARHSEEPEILARALMACAEIDLLDGPDFSDATWATIDEATLLLESLDPLSPRSAMNRLILRAWRALRTEDYPAAAAWHQQCLDLSLANGAAFFEATAHFNLAEVAELAGDFTAAIEHYRLAADTSYRFDGLVSATDALVYASRLLTRTGEHQAAVDFAAEAVLAARRARSASGLRSALLTLSTAAADAGDHHRAFRARSEADAELPATRASAL